MLQRLREKGVVGKKKTTTTAVAAVMGDASVFAGDRASSSSAAIDSSNIGFRLLKKCGWEEGTGLGVSQQGRLEPLQPQVKNNKRGIGADKIKKYTKSVKEDSTAEGRVEKDHVKKNKAKQASKRMRKILEEEKRMQEKEFEKAFFREFWPDNV